jgi:hypothetical protein
MSVFDRFNFQNQLSRIGAFASQVAINADRARFASLQQTGIQNTDRIVVDLTEFYKQLKARTGGSRASDPITSSIAQQRSFIGELGFALPNRFTLFLEGVDAAVNERLARNCQSVSLPGRSIQSQPHKIYGPPREMIYEANFPNEIQLTFRVSEDMFERDFFDMWINKSISYTSFDLEYPDYYSTGLKIYQLDKTDNYLYCMQLYNVFCKGIGDIEMSSDASDQIETVNITLGYTEHQVIGYRVGRDRTVARQRAAGMREDISAFLSDLPKTESLFGSGIPFGANGNQSQSAIDDIISLRRSSSTQQRASSGKLPSVGGVPITSATPGASDPIESNIYNTSSSPYGISSRGGIPISVESGESTSAATTASVQPGGVPTSVEGGDIDNDEIDDGIGPKYPQIPETGNSVPVLPPS